MGKITQNQTGSNSHSTIRSKEPVDIDIDTIDGFRIEASSKSWGANALRLAKAAGKAKPVSKAKTAAKAKPAKLWKHNGTGLVFQFDDSLFEEASKTDDVWAREMYLNQCPQLVFHDPVTATKPKGEIFHTFSKYNETTTGDVAHRAFGVDIQHFWTSKEDWLRDFTPCKERNPFTLETINKFLTFVSGGRNGGTLYSTWHDDYEGTNPMSVYNFHQQLVAEETSKLKKVCFGSYNCGIDTPQEIAWTIPPYTTVHGEKYPAVHLCATCEDSEVTCPSDCGCLTRDTESLVDICYSVGGYGLWCDKCVRDHTTEQITTDQLGNRYIEYVAK